MKTGCHCLGASHIRNNKDRHFSHQEQRENQQKIQQNLTSTDTDKYGLVAGY